MRKTVCILGLFFVCLASGCANSPTVSGSDFKIVRASSSDTAASLASDFYGDPREAWRIEELNGFVEAGQAVLIPGFDPRPAGIFPSGTQGAVVLSYHHIADEEKCSGVTVCVGQFEEQLDFLARNNFQVVSLKTLNEHMENGVRLAPKTVVITFDDGWKSTYEYGYPLLAKYNMPATLFVYTDFINARAGLSWDELRELKDSGIFEIHSHSKSHANMPKILNGSQPSDRSSFLQEEVDFPSRALQKQIGIAPFAFAYPYGAANSEIALYLDESDYRMGLTVTRGANPAYAYPYLMRRTMIYGNDTIEAFAKKVSGIHRRTE